MENNNILRGLLGGLAVAGVAISAYLAYSHLAGTAPVCAGGSGGCETVQASRYSEVLGVPVGVFGYAAMLLAALIRTEKAAVFGVFFALTGALYSAYLTYLELFVIGAICQWCIASALVVVAYLILASLRLGRTGTAPDTLSQE